MANCISLCSVRCSGGQQGTSSMQITWLIASGQLKPGDRLPTVRRLAEHLSINLHTVRSAYQKLEMQGLVQTRRGRGAHVFSFDPRLVAQAAGPLRSHTVGVIVAGWGNPFYHTFLRGVEEVAEEDQTLLILCTTHDDHAVVARLVERASYLATRPALLPEHEPLIPQPHHLTFPLSFQRPCRPSLVLDITDVYGVKQKALQAHGSQYGPILFAVDIAARYYGRMINVGYGEGFLHKEPLPLTRDLAIL